MTEKTPDQLQKRIQELENELAALRKGREPLSLADKDSSSMDTKDTALESDEKFKSLFNGINQPVFVHPLKSEGFNTFVEVNDKALQEYGYSREEFLKLTPMDITVVAEAQDKGTAEFRNKLKEEGQIVFETTHLTKEGKKFPVEISSNIYDWLGQKVILSIAKNISDRKQGETELQEAVSIWKTTFDAMSDSVSIIDYDGNIIKYNSATLKLFNVSDQEIKDNHCWQLVHRLSEPIENCPIVRMKKSKQPESMIFQDGERWLEVSVDPVVNPEGKINGAVHIVSDITERIHAEEALRESELRFRNIYESGAIGIALSEINNTFLTANPRFCQMLGYEKEELMTKTFFDITYQDDLELSKNFMKKFAQENPPYAKIEKRYTKKNGQIFYGQTTISKVPGKEGKPPYMLGIIEDITERVKAELALHESEEKYRHLIEDSGDAIYFLYNRHFEIINKKFTDLFGISFEQANSADFDFMNLVHPDSRSIIEERIQLQSEGKILDPKYEFKAINAQGKVIIVEASVTHIKYKQGVAAQGIIRDVTDKRQLEQQLQQAQKMEAIGTLAGGVAHDFNNLLTVINGYSELALRKIDKQNDAHLFKIIDAILNAGGKAENLTRQLLAFSRKQIFKTEILDINNTISSMDKMLRRLIGEDINIITVLDEDVPKIKADSTQLEQIIMNLMVNARDAVYAVSEQAFTKKITIETGLVDLDEEFVAKHPGSSKGAHVFFSISDTGIGMDDETKLKIFEPFFTTKDKFKGTGLGLSTVYGIVKQNNGYVDVCSKPSQGTTFKIYWPITIERSSSNPDGKNEKQNLSGSETILLVEDDADVRSFTSEALKSLGYIVHKAANGVRALEILKSNEHEFDLILTDLIMPELNGKEFIKKAEKIIPNIKVIYVSGYTNDHIAHNGLLDEDITFIQKPYSVKTLAGNIRHLLKDG